MKTKLMKSVEKILSRLMTIEAAGVGAVAMFIAVLGLIAVSISHEFDTCSVWQKRSLDVMLKLGIYNTFDNFDRCGDRIPDTSGMKVFYITQRKSDYCISPIPFIKNGWYDPFIWNDLTHTSHITEEFYLIQNDKGENVRDNFIMNPLYCDTRTHSIVFKGEKGNLSVQYRTLKEMLERKNMLDSLFKQISPLL